MIDPGLVALLIVVAFLGGLFAGLGLMGAFEKDGLDG